MKLRNIAFLGLGLAAINLSAQTPKPPTTASGAPNLQATPVDSTPPTKEELSYVVGMNFGNTIKKNDLDIDLDTMAAAIKDVINGNPTKIKDKDAQDIVNRWRTAARVKQQKEMKEKGAVNEKAGDDFRAKFAKEEGTLTAGTNLYYKIITPGTGEQVKTTDTVTVNYKGTFIDGAEFDHGDGFTTPVQGRTITGWSKILPLMKVGSKYHVVIPPELAYGPFGQPPKIPAMSTLIFDIEVVSIAAAPPAPVTPPPALPAPPHASVNPAPQGSGQVVSGQIIKVPSRAELDKGAKIEVIDANDPKAAQPK